LCGNGAIGSRTGYRRVERMGGEYFGVIEKSAIFGIYVLYIVLTA
jgi:hypothetical protein